MTGGNLNQPRQGQARVHSYEVYVLKAICTVSFKWMSFRLLALVRFLQPVQRKIAYGQGDMETLSQTGAKRNGHYIPLSFYYLTMFTEHQEITLPAVIVIILQHFAEGV